MGFLNFFRGTPPEVKSARNAVSNALKAYITTYNSVTNANRASNKNSSQNFRAMNNINKPLIRALRVYINAVRPFVAVTTGGAGAPPPPPPPPPGAPQVKNVVTAANAVITQVNIAARAGKNLVALQENKAAASEAANAARQMRNKLSTLAKARTSLAFSRMNKRLKNLNAAIAEAQRGAGGGAGGAGPAAVNASLVALRAVLDEYNNQPPATGAVPANANKAAALQQVNDAVAAITTAGLQLNQANQARLNRIRQALSAAGAPPPAPANLNTNLTRILGNATRNFSGAPNQAQFKLNAKTAINAAATAAGVPLTNQRVVNAKATINALNP